MLTAEQKTITLEPGWYDQQTTITTTIEPTINGKVTYTYVHHEHSEDGITATEVENNKSASSSINSHPAYLKSPSGCYTKIGILSHTHPTNQLSGSQGEWKTCRYCGSSLQLTSKGSEEPGTPTFWHAYCSGWSETVYYPSCGYDNGEVTDIKFHFEK